MAPYADLPPTEATSLPKKGGIEEATTDDHGVPDDAEHRATLRNAKLELL
jgi:hypothetical protein